MPSIARTTVPFLLLALPAAAFAQRLLPDDLAAVREGIARDGTATLVLRPAGAAPVPTVFDYAGPSSAGGLYLSGHPDVPDGSETGYVVLLIEGGEVSGSLAVDRDGRVERWRVVRGRLVRRRAPAHHH